MTGPCPVCGGADPLTGELPVCRCGSTWATRPRKPLQRRTPLAGGKGLAPGKGLTRSAAPARTGAPIARTPAVPKPRRPRVAAAVRLAVRTRSHGLCEVGVLATCRARGRVLDAPGVGGSQHHRRPGGMGGSTRTDTNEAANLLQVCGHGTAGCHGWIESHRELAYGMGVLLRQDQDPASTPARLWDGRRVLLTASGYVPVGASDTDEATA